jgi:hypothetical protein
MNKLTRVLAVLVLVAALGSALMLQGGRSSRSQAQEEAPPPHAIMIEEKLCIVLLVALSNVNSTTAALRCVDLYDPTSLAAIAGFLTQSNGSDTPVFDPDLVDDPGTEEREDRVDIPCTVNTDGDDELCDPGDIGVDDENEVLALLDLRDDGELNEEFELLPSDFAGVDLDANQLHEVDGTLDILVFNDGDDHPVRFRPEAGFIQEPVGGQEVDDIACGSADILGASWFDEDCDDDDVIGDGVKLARMVPSSPAPDRGDYQLRITETDRETFLDYSVVGEGDDFAFTPLKTKAQNGTDEEDCTFELSVAGVVASLSNPHIAIVLLHVLDSDGTQIANTLLDWAIDPDGLAFPFLPQTPTVDTGSTGKGFPQAICGDEGTGIAEANVIFSHTASIDPAKPLPDCEILADWYDDTDTDLPAVPDPCDESGESGTIEITIVGPPASITSVVSEPAEIPCDGTSSTTLTVTVVDENGDLVANGTDVEFSLQVLGTANPISVKTSDGVAKSTITPLAAIGTGAPVIITAGEDDAQTSVLVKCAAGSPQQPAQPGATPGAGQPGTGITGPDTGSGGLSGGRGELSYWPAIALFVAAMGLVGARFGLRRIR